VEELLCQKCHKEPADPIECLLYWCSL